MSLARALADLRRRLPWRDKITLAFRRNRWGVLRTRARREADRRWQSAANALAAGYLACARDDVLRALRLYEIANRCERFRNSIPRSDVDVA